MVTETYWEGCGARSASPRTRIIRLLYAPPWTPSVFARMGATASERIAIMTEVLNNMMLDGFMKFKEAFSWWVDFDVGERTSFLTEHRPRDGVIYTIS